MTEELVQPEPLYKIVPQLELIEDPYLAIQGEGTKIGQPMVFVRTAVCPVGCIWCDSEYTFGRGTKWPFEKVYEKILSFNCPNIWFTGGEPTIWAKEIADFIRSCHQAKPGYFIFHICTSGTYWNDATRELFNLLDHITVDIKLKTAHTKIPTSWDLINWLIETRVDNTFEFKTVMGKDDQEEVKELAGKICRQELPLTIQPVYLPFEGSIVRYQSSAHVPEEAEDVQLVLNYPDPAWGYKEIDQWVKQNLSQYPMVRYLPQWHKVVYPDIDKGI